MKNLNYLVIIDKDNEKHLLNICNISGIFLLEHIETIQTVYNQSILKDVYLNSVSYLCCQNYKEIFFLLTKLRLDPDNKENYYMQYKENIVEFNTITVPEYFKDFISNLDNSVFGRE